MEVYRDSSGLVMIMARFKLAKLWRLIGHFVDVIHLWDDAPFISQTILSCWFVVPFTCYFIYLLDPGHTIFIVYHTTLDFPNKAQILAEYVTCHYIPSYFGVLVRKMINVLCIGLEKSSTRLCISMLTLYCCWRRLSNRFKYLLKKT